MTRLRNQRKVLCLGVSIAAVLLVCNLAGLTEARVGGGSSLGSRGSRSYSAPARPSTPSPGNAFGQRSAPPSAPYSSPYSQRQDAPYSRPSPFPQTSPYGGGGFWRSVGGGLLGGFLGSMLFRSFGSASYGGYGGYGGGWGGPGLFDLLLLGLIGYVAYRFLTRKSNRTRENADAEWRPVNRDYDNRYDVPETIESHPPPQRSDVARGIEQIRTLDQDFDPVRFCDWAMDCFFRLQAAWSARDLSPVRTLLTDELFAQLQAEIDRLKREGKINHIENIAVRTCELTEAWQETGQDFATVYFYANCLDYDVNETTGEVVRGSKLEPTKFEEYWTFTRPAGGNPWKLSAITQA
jgi:predicted lipid-binding transport protein (Tim44 family)